MSLRDELDESLGPAGIGAARPRAVIVVEVHGVP